MTSLRSANICLYFLSYIVLSRSFRGFCAFIRLNRDCHMLNARLQFFSSQDQSGANERGRYAKRWIPSISISVLNWSNQFDHFNKLPVHDYSLLGQQSIKKKEFFSSSIIMSIRFDHLHLSQCEDPVYERSTRSAAMELLVQLCLSRTLCEISNLKSLRQFMTF